MSNLPNKNNKNTLQVNQKYKMYNNTRMKFYTYMYLNNPDNMMVCNPGGAG